MNQTLVNLPAFPLPPICQLVLRFRTMADGALPRRKHSAMRGLIGHALKAIVPETYRVLYEGSIAADHPYARRFQRPPAPYVIECHSRKLHIPKGELLLVHLCLIGQAIDHLEPLLKACETLADKGLGRDRIPLRLADILLEETPPLPVPQPHCRLRLHSPLRIVQGGKLADPLSCSLLVHRLAERINLLGHFHAGSPLIEDFQPWIEAADTVSIHDAQLNTKAWHRHGKARQEDQSLVGWTGQIVYTQVHPGLYPLLHAGSQLRLGKGAPWGMGRFSLEPLATLPPVSALSASL